MKMIVLLIIAVLICAVQPVCTDPQVTATYWAVDGGYRFAFTLTAGQYEVPDWGIYRTDATDLVAPDGWNGNNPGFKYTYWLINDLSNPLQPGQAKQGFEANLPELPAQINYFIDEMHGDDFFYGTLIPTPVPEPSSLIALAGGLTGVGGTLLRRRKM